MAAELTPSGKASTKSRLELSHLPRSLLVFVPATAHGGVDSVFCPSAVPPPDSPTALCGEKFALFNNYCTLA